MRLRSQRFTLLFAALLACQLGFWQHTHKIRPALDIVPPPPGETALHALTFGDRQFYFRMLALELQNFGDTYGRFTPLKSYDFKRLTGWFTVLDTLDSRSDVLPALAANYYSQTQNTADVRYLVDYLYAHASRDVTREWWWLLQAVYLSMYKLEDNALAEKVADAMLNPEVPAFAQTMAAVVREKNGEMEDALHIMEGIRANAKIITESDLKYMQYFVKERIGTLDEKAK